MVKPAKLERRTPTNQLFIGATDSLAPFVLPPILSKLMRTPAQIVCSTDHSGLLIKRLLDGPLQLAFIVASSAPATVQVRVLRRVPVVCVTTPRSSLVRHERHLMADLARGQLALYRWSPDADLVADFLQSRDLKMPQLRQLAPLSTARKLVMARDLACFLPSLAVADDLAAGRLVRLRVADAPRWTWDICVAHRSELKSSAAGKVILRALNAIAWTRELS